jgi:hypothetical protein
VAEEAHPGPIRVDPMLAGAQPRCRHLGPQQVPDEPGLTGRDRRAASISTARDVIPAA